MVIKLIVALVLVLSLAAVACGNDELLEGDVDHKTVTGVIDGTGFTILRNIPSNDPDVADPRPFIQVSDQEFSGFFTTGDEHLVITAAMETELSQKYSDLRYIVHVQVSGVEQDTQSYYADRDIFNRIDVEVPIRFEASGSPRPTIHKLVN